MKLSRLVLSWFIAGRACVRPSVADAARRLRLMLGQTWLMALGAVLLAGSAIGAVLYLESLPTTLRIAVGPAAGDDAGLVQAMAAQFDRDRAAIRLRPVLKDNPVAAAAAIDSGDADLAVVRRDRAYPKQGLAVAVLRENVVAMIVPVAGSLARGGAAGERAAKPRAKRGDKNASVEKLEKVEHIAGKRIGVIERGGANTDLLNVVLRQYGIVPEKVTIVPLDPDDVAASLRSHPVDVIFGAGPVTSKFFTAAIAAAAKGGKDPHFLPITASEAITRRLPVYEATELKKGVFGGHSPLPEDDVETISYSHYIVAQQGLQEAVVSDLTRLIFSVRERLAAEFPTVRQIQKPDTDKDAVVLAHPGAAAFIDDHLQSFFDKYSDFIYLGLMLLSGLGSGAAWLTSYSRADDQIRKLRPVETLLDMAKTARDIDSIDALDTLREEIDEILRKTMSEVERKELDAAVLFPLSVALNQAQAAISERRAQLTARPPASAPASAQVTAQVTPLRVALGE
jgi:TRAP-type uncharacterized transport system substrate-binding protein